MSTDLIKQSPTALEAAPTFMDDDGQMGMELISKKVRPPFLKIIQKQSSDQLLTQFGKGAAILVPDQTLVVPAGSGESVRIVPIFFFVEYLKMAPIILKDQETMIAARSMDPKSEIARRCADRRQWEEQHPQHPGDARYNYRYCESLNFLCYFQEEHLQMPFPFVMTFMRGSFGKGQQFCNLISMRQRPPFGCVFSLGIDPVLGKNAQGEWTRLLIENPPEKPWVESPEEYSLYRRMHGELKRLYESGDIEVPAEDAAVDEQSGEASTGEF